MSTALDEFLRIFGLSRDEFLATYRDECVPCDCRAELLEDTEPNLDRKDHRRIEVRFEYYLLGKTHSACLLSAANSPIDLDASIVRDYDQRCSNACIVLKYFCPNLGRDVIRIGEERLVAVEQPRALFNGLFRWAKRTRFMDRYAMV